VSVANVCRQLGEFFEVFPNLADRHELKTTNKNLDLTASDAWVHESRHRKTSRFPVSPSLFSLSLEA
jgi:hypothetical protein